MAQANICDKCGKLLDSAPTSKELCRCFIRYATKEEFEKAHAKVMKLHAGLFRRLAK